MDRNFFIILDDLELRMIHANSLAPQARPAKHNQALPGCDHLLHVMQIEPTAHQWFTQRVRLRFLQCCFEDLLPAAKTAQRRFNHFTAKTNWNVAFFAWKMRELGSILMTARKMRKQILHGTDTEPSQRQQTRSGDPRDVFERLRNPDHLGSAGCQPVVRGSLPRSPFLLFVGVIIQICSAFRTASIRMPSVVSPSYSSARMRKAMSQGAGGSERFAESK